jgi:hypothetical protein
MSVTTTYVGGGLGNSLFQYAYARLFAEKNGLFFDSGDPNAPYGDVVEMAPSLPGLSVDTPVIEVNENQGNLLTMSSPPGRYYFNGFFQKSEWYIPHATRIREFMRPRQAVETVNEDDVVLHMRLGGNPNIKHKNWDSLGGLPLCTWISPEWYCNVLRKLSFRKLYVVTADPQPRYIAAFKEFSPVVVTQSTEQDWNFLRTFRRIILSNSTFCWWAWFFGVSTQAFVFSRWSGYPNYFLGSFPGLTPVDGPFDLEVAR